MQKGNQGGSLADVLRICFLQGPGRFIGGSLWTTSCAGECAGGLCYEDYIGGASMANCLVMGRIAGQEAAKKK